MPSGLRRAIKLIGCADLNAPFRARAETGAHSDYVSTLNEWMASNLPN